MRTSERDALEARVSGRRRTLHAAVRLAPTGLLLLALAGAAAIAIVPLLCLLAASVRGPDGFTLAAYTDVLDSPRQWRLLRHSATIAGAVGLLSTVLGLGVAWCIARTKFPAKRTLVIALMLPVVIPPYILAMGWVDLLGANGAVNRCLAALLGLKGSPVSLYGIPGCVWIMSLCWYPLPALTATCALLAVDRQQEDAGLLFVGRHRTFFGITLARTLPACLAGGLLVALLATGEYAVPCLLQVQVYAVEIHALFSAFYDVAGATAASAPLAVTGIIGLAAFGVLLRRLRAADVQSMAVRSRARVCPVCFTCCLSMALVAVVLPVGALVARAGAPGNYWLALVSARGQLLHSLEVAALSASLVCVLGFALVYLTRYLNPVNRALIDAASVIPFVVSGSLLGIGLILMWNHPGIGGRLYRSAAILVLACTAKYAALGILPLRACMHHVPPELDEAARVHGVARWRIMTRVYVVLCLPVLAAAWILVFAFSVGELNASVLVSPPGFATAGVRLFTLLHYGMNTVVAALAIILLAAAVVPLVLGYCALRKPLRKWHAGNPLREPQ